MGLKARPLMTGFQAHPTF